MDKWNNLSMAERAKYIKLGVQNGTTNLNNIRETYNSYAEGGHINRFDDGGSMTTITDDFRKSILPPSLDNYIKENYGYRRYKLQDSIRDSISIEKKNKPAFVDNDNKSANNTSSTKAEPDAVEVSVSKPGTYFPMEWGSLPTSTVDTEGNYHTDFPDVYRIEDKPLTFEDKVYRRVNTALNSNPITSNTRVRNMQKADMSNYFDLSPRQVASGMSFLGSLLTKTPMAPYGYAMQLPDLLYDSYDLFHNRNMGNLLSVAGDVAGILPLNKIPSIPIPIGKSTVDVKPIVSSMAGYGNIEDAVNATGRELPLFDNSQDPDTIRIHSTPQGGYGEYIHTPWEEFNKRKEKEEK